MGAVSGLWALDVDLDHGGEASLHELEAELGELPRTIESITGGGGRHLLFNHPGYPIKNRVAVRPGLDIRGDGGLIIAPPSIHPSGRRYAWATGCAHKAADAPEWLLELVREEPANDTIVVPLVPRRPSRYAAAALRRACEAVASAEPGTRNHTLNAEAFGIGQLVAAGLIQKEHAVAALAAAAFECGLEEAEITSTLASGLRAGMRQPREEFTNEAA